MSLDFHSSVRSLSLPRNFAQFPLLSFLALRFPQDFTQILCIVCWDGAVFALFGNFVPRISVRSLFLVISCELFAFAAIIRVYLIDFVFV